MNLSELIELAVEKAGGRKELAEGLGMHKNRLTDWKGGSRKPDAHEIAYLAKIAGLPVLSTVAEIESQLDERFSSIWSEALGKLTAAGVAASVMAVAFGFSPETANASPARSLTDRVCILCQPKEIQSQKRNPIDKPDIPGPETSIPSSLQVHNAGIDDYVLPPCDKLSPI